MASLVKLLLFFQNSTAYATIDFLKNYLTNLAIESGKEDMDCKERSNFCQLFTNTKLEVQSSKRKRSLNEFQFHGWFKLRLGNINNINLKENIPDYPAFKETDIPFLFFILNPLVANDSKKANQQSLLFATKGFNMLKYETSEKAVDQQLQQTHELSNGSIVKIPNMSLCSNKLNVEQSLFIDSKVKGITRDLQSMIVVKNYNNKFKFHCLDIAF